MGNIVTAAVQSKVRRTVTEALYQYDYGQILQITGVDLPTEYEVHFSNKPSDIDATTVLGNADGVPIPDIYLTTGKSVYAWLFLHTGLDDGETVHTIEIPVWKRPKATDTQPTPVQQDTITEVIAALNSAVSSVETIVSDIPGTIDTAIREAKESGEFDGVSPEATVTKEGRETTIRITDANGTTTAKVYDGETPDVSGKLDVAEKGAANGVAELDSSGKVPVSQLPSYVDDVVEYDSIDVSAWDEWEPGETYRVGDRRKVTSYPGGEMQVTGYVCTAANNSTSIRTDEWRTADVFPVLGETSKIYVALDTNTTYRWGGSEYVPIGSSLALSETSETAYRGDRGKAAYDAAVLNLDYEPTQNSTHLITSGGVYDYINRSGGRVLPTVTRVESRTIPTGIVRTLNVLCNGPLLRDGTVFPLVIPEEVSAIWFEIKEVNYPDHRTDRMRIAGLDDYSGSVNFTLAPGVYWVSYTDTSGTGEYGQYLLDPDGLVGMRDKLSSAAVAPDYGVGQQTFQKDDLRTHDGLIYKANTNASETWNPAHWDVVELRELYTMIATINASIRSIRQDIQVATVAETEEIISEYGSGGDDQVVIYEAQYAIDDSWIYGYYETLDDAADIAATFKSGKSVMVHLVDPSNNNGDYYLQMLLYAEPYTENNQEYDAAFGFVYENIPFGTDDPEKTTNDIASFLGYSEVTQNGKLRIKYPAD